MYSYWIACGAFFAFFFGLGFFSRSMRRPLHLECLDASLEDVVLCVQNNHHHRVAPFEERLPFGVEQGHYDEHFLSPLNVLPCRTVELSHHLAHAWSALGTSPWAPPLAQSATAVPPSDIADLAAASAADANDGADGAGDADGGDASSSEGEDARKTTLVVVMDGMGELYSEMNKDVRNRARLEELKRRYEAAMKDVV